MTSPEERRFQQKVRSMVRAHVMQAREAPSLTLWCSEGGNPRRVLAAAVGAAEDGPGVREYIVAQVELHRPRWVALGRGLHVPGDEEGVLEATTLFGLTFITAESVESINTEIVAGEMGAWRPTQLSTSLEESQVDSFFFIQQALRRVAR